MSEITWNDLDEIEQDLLKTLDAIGNPVSMLWTDINRKMIRLGLIAKVSRGIDTTFKATLTPAGRALLPAGEAVDKPAFPVGEMRYVAAEPVGAKSAFDMMLADYESLSDKIATLQAELAAALARAQAAEGERDALRTDNREAMTEIGRLRNVMLEALEFLESENTPLEQVCKRATGVITHGLGGYE